MPSFEYQAIDATGHRSSGVLEGLDRGEVVRKLTRKGLQAHSVKLAGAADPKPNKAAAGAKTAEGAPRKKSASDAKTANATASERVTLKRKQVIQFTEELTDLLAAGLQLEQALHAMENRSSKLLSGLAIRLRELVRDGVPFSVALTTSSPSFGELYCSLVAAGEASGSLNEILARQAQYLTTMESIRAKVTTALVYPAFIILSGIALGVIFITYLIPKLTVLIQNVGGKMPAIASFLTGVSDFLKGWWWAVLLAIGLAGAAVKIFLADRERRKIWHRVMLDLPMYGSLLRTRFEIQFLETLGNLLTNGLPLHRGLELVRKTTMNLYLNEQLGTVETLVGDGASLSRSVEKTGVARPLVVDMIRVGEQTGELATALRKAAERFDRQLSNVIDQATAALQPIIILAMAGMVGSMAWMMISVVYSTLENLRHHH